MRDPEPSMKSDAETSKTKAVEPARGKAAEPTRPVIKRGAESSTSKAHEPSIAPSTIAESNILILDSDSDSDGNEMISGKGRVATPPRDPRKNPLGKLSIKQITDYTLKDPTTYNVVNLKIKTNKKVFRQTETPEAERLPPQGWCFRSFKATV